MKKLIICIYLLLISVLYANFEIAPEIQEIDLSRQMTKKIHLKNGTNKLKKIKIYSQRPEDQKTKDLYMGNWIIVYPKIVYLKPNSKKIIRMAARHPQGLAEGEYRSHLVFEELPVKKYDNSEKDEKKVGVDIQIMYKLITTVYGYRGKLEYGGSFDDFKIIEDGKKIHLASKITNTGTAALNIFYRITYYKNMKVLKTEDVVVEKIMRENDLDSLVELNKISKGANKMKVEFYYRLKNKKTKENEGEKEYNEFKIGEKLISIKKLSMEEYTKGLKKVGNEKAEKEKEKNEEKKDS